MRISINSDVLKKYSLTWEEFIILLMGRFNVDYSKEYESLIKKHLVERNLFSESPPILSDNTKNLIAKIVTESDSRLADCGIKDFEALAEMMQLIFPDGCKPGTSYKWKGVTSDIAQKLRILVVQYDFRFTEEEALNAADEYVTSFKDTKRMKLLRNFILTTHSKGPGHQEIESDFMSIIENNRDERKEHD